MRTFLGILFSANIFILIISTSRLTFVKKKIFSGWIDRSKKITLFDYVGNFDGAWIGKLIDYAGLMSVNPHDKQLRDCVKEVKILKSINIIAVTIGFLVCVLATILDL